MSGKDTKSAIAPRVKRARNADTAANAAASRRSNSTVIQAKGREEALCTDEKFGVPTMEQRAANTSAALFVMADVAKRNFGSRTLREGALTAAFLSLSGITAVSGAMRRMIRRELERC